MKPASTALQDLLASRQFFAADLYTFTLINGTALRYCSGDRDITAGGDLFTAQGPRVDRKDNKAKCHWKIGVEVDTLVFDVMPQATDMVNGLPFLAACVQGAFDGAELQLERAFMATYGDTSVGTVIMFAGRVAEIDLGRAVATFTINSHLELLNLQLPRNLWQPGCVNSLGDASCGVNLPSFAVAGSAAAGSSASMIATSLAQADELFRSGQGYVHERRECRPHALGQILGRRLARFYRAARAVPECAGHRRYFHHLSRLRQDAGREWLRQIRQHRALQRLPLRPVVGDSSVVALSDHHSINLLGLCHGSTRCHAKRARVFARRHFQDMRLSNVEAAPLRARPNKKSVTSQPLSTAPRLCTDRCCRLSNVRRVFSKVGLWRRRKRSPAKWRKEWEPDEHPRWPTGSPDSIGGQFSPKDSGDEQVAQEMFFARPPIDDVPQLKETIPPS